MVANFGQIYIEAGVDFPFSYHAQILLSNSISPLLEVSPKFLANYGKGFELMFNISAKRRLSDNEIKGPTVFKKTKDVEYTIFLPYDVIRRAKDEHRLALGFIFKGVYSVLESIDVDTTEVRKVEPDLIDTICADPTMFE
jgi:hypothetical protein